MEQKKVNFEKSRQYCEKKKLLGKIVKSHKFWDKTKIHLWRQNYKILIILAEIINNKTFLTKNDQKNKSWAKRTKWPIKKCESLRSFRSTILF